MKNKPRSTTELLREFATFSSTGIRGIIRMKRLQEEAQARLALIDRARELHTEKN